jgi:hypothetical protein
MFNIQNKTFDIQTAQRTLDPILTTQGNIFDHTDDYLFHRTRLDEHSKRRVELRVPSSPVRTSPKKISPVRLSRGFEIGFRAWGRARRARNG